LKSREHVSPSLSILLLQGDAEAQLLADAELALQTVIPDRVVTLTRAWSTRPDWLDISAPGPPSSFRERGIIENADVRDLLAQPHGMVIFSFLSSIAQPALRHRSGGVFIAHRTVVANWSPSDAAAVQAECTLEAPLSAEAAAQALEPVIVRLLNRGLTVAVATAFRHTNEPLQHRRPAGPPSLRELVRRANLEVTRLSQRTGCFVLDFDRPLSKEGGGTLATDCFGGGEKAAEIALEEFATLVLDMVADSLPSEEIA